MYVRYVVGGRNPDDFLRYSEVTRVSRPENAREIAQWLSTVHGPTMVTREDHGDTTVVYRGVIAGYVDGIMVQRDDPRLLV